MRIGQLFAVELRLHNQRVGPGETRIVRQQSSRPILEAIQTHLTNLPHCVLTSILARARADVFGLWDELQEFLEHGEVPLHNNPVENGIWPTKLGAKNWMFIAGEVSPESLK